MRSGRQLLLDSRAYAIEDRAASWWCLLSTLALFVALEVVIVALEPLVPRLIASLIAGLVFVRLFILYHDSEHGTILKKSRFAWALLSVYGLITLNPPSIWRRSHDHHHKHNAQMYGADIGSFPVMTIDQWRKATRLQRLAHAASRHPLTFLLAYFTVFAYGMCIRSLITNPRRHIDSAVSLMLHIALIVALALIGVDVLLLCFLLPAAVASCLGSYLFYAQHNFPATQFKTSENWDYVTAALESSSYMHMSPLMAWFTGNIGYHHVHHLNHNIPFYKLPMVMNEMPELQSPGTTSLRPRDVLACLRLKLWDPERNCLVPFPKRHEIESAAASV